MIRISNLKYPLSENIDDEGLKVLISKTLKCSESDILSLDIHKLSIDARERLGGYYILTLDVSLKNEKKYEKYKNVSKSPKPFEYIVPKKKIVLQPVVVGFGPAGIFSALILAKSGLNPIIIERGKMVKERSKDISDFWKNGKLDLNSNVQFGEGGAGTFSDGKLTTGIKDYRCKVVLEEFVKFGAPKEILYLAKPHIGTDKLIPMVEKIREFIISIGGKFLFNHRFTDFISKNNEVTGALVENLENNEVFEVPTNNIVLAIGHSSRDTFEMLYKKGLLIEQKPFAVGVRIEHNQNVINSSQYGEYAKYLPSADYKLAIHLSNSRSAYTFCMCPGGYVVASSSEHNRLVTNGMSYYSRNGENANSALLIGVYPSDFGNDNHLAGIFFQRELEERAFVAGGSNYFAPVQTIGDLLKDKTSIDLGDVVPTYMPGIKLSNMNEIFPDYIYDSLKLGIIEMGKRIKGFSDESGILTAVESRTSSPIKIVRDEFTLMTPNLKGLYPCGEGCGYAGGIVSASVDGIRVSEALLEKL